VHRAAAWAVLILVVGLAAAASAQDPARLDPVLAAWVDAGSAAAARGEALAGLQAVPGPTGEVRVKVLARATERVSGGTLGGIPVCFSAGTVVSLLVSRSELLQLLEDRRVAYVESSWRTRPALDESVAATGADRAHEATPAVDGTGVIVGFVDTGIDVRHLDFRYDANRDGREESSRVLALWDQTWGLFGATYSQEDIEADLASGAGPDTGIVREADRDGHGTHVAGIAAGDGSSSSAGFRGVAPAAWIVAVKTTFFTADILEGVGYIFDEAERRGLPAVVNLSLGGQEGPHDGTSAFEQGLDELAQGAGRAIVVSAGNEGDLAIHVSGLLQGGIRTFELEAGAREITMEIWYPGASRFSISVMSPSGASSSASTGTGSGFVPSPEGIAYIDNASGGVNPNNGDREAFVRITNTTSGTRWRVSVRDEGGGGRFDGWVTTDAGRIVDGDSTSTIDEPGNARSAITVGSFNTKGSWPSRAGQQDELDPNQLGVLSGFSSQGPTRDGRTKPDVTAPGAWICATLSSSSASPDYLLHPDGFHVMHRGTSMAAPHVAGAVALLFDVDPKLTGSEVLDLLTRTASHDEYTGSVPNVRWGFGKLDVWAALLNLEPTDPPTPSRTRPTVSIERNPAVEEATFTYTLPEGTSEASLHVYDVAGARVFDTKIALAGSSVTWDLRTTSGERAAAGLYLYVVTSDLGNSNVERLVIAP
jgi:subtilisin family serine protease